MLVGEYLVVYMDIIFDFGFDFGVGEMRLMSDMGIIMGSKLIVIVDDILLLENDYFVMMGVLLVVNLNLLMEVFVEMFMFYGGDFILLMMLFGVRDMGVLRRFFYIFGY